MKLHINSIKQRIRPLKIALPFSIRKELMCAHSRAFTFYVDGFFCVLDEIDFANLFMQFYLLNIECLIQFGASSLTARSGLASLLIPIKMSRFMAFFVCCCCCCWFAYCCLCHFFLKSNDIYAIFRFHWTIKVNTQ